MSSSIGFVCDAEDDYNFIKFSESLGLYLVPFDLERPVDLNPADGPACYLSLVPESKLHPYGEPPVKIADVIDPMLFLLRGYYKSPYLVFGQMQWNNDNKSLGRQTRPYYDKLVTWIKSNWRKYNDTYVGPQADVHLQAGAKIVPVLPGTATFTTIDSGDVSGAAS